jgi:D-beta-D-heptose 7-phosphate kinase/D-beta-D-heptose 1-phosphate adenosyltransferase
MVNETRCDLLNKFTNKINLSKKTIHVIGDSLIDEDYKVKVHRISPECPNVNILHSEDDIPFRCFPGGAANVCYQLNNFNVLTRLFTFIDSEAYFIIKQHGIKNWGHVALPDGYYVPRKKRYYEKGCQVVCRRDIERAKYGLPSVSGLQGELVCNWFDYYEEADAIIFSDYNKGIFADTFHINWFTCSKAIKIVDPKAAPLKRWVGCTVFKPNATEAYNLSGERDWQKQCDFFKNELKCNSVVITQEGDGVVGKVDDYFEVRPKEIIKPVDIIGAGDCFIGMLSLALVNGFSVPEAAQIAFYGGLHYVQQMQRGMFGPWSFHSTGKILNNYEFLKSRSYKLVFTNGCFDLMHSGHLHTLETAKSKGDKLLVAVNSDESIKRLKGDARPILPLMERMRLLAALDCVDFVVSFDEDTPQRLIEEVRPDILIKGADWVGKPVAGSDCVKEVFYVPLMEGLSTTGIIEKIQGEIWKNKTFTIELK